MDARSRGSCLTSVSARRPRGPLSAPPTSLYSTSMSLRFSSLQRRRGLLFNFTIVLFLAFFAIALVFSTRCNFQTPCTPSDVIDNKWLTLWGLRSPNEKGSFSINDRQRSAVIEDDEEVIGPAYCPVCGPGDALCAKYGYVTPLYYVF